MLKSKKILLKISGSIAAYKSAYLVSKLIQSGHEVKIAATKSALEFVGNATFEGLTGEQVYTDTFESGKMMSHIELIKWADIVLFAPATANSINKMAAGIGDSLPSSLFLAHDWNKPYFIAPAMNTKMYEHPATKESLKKLESWGVRILPADTGYLACGDTGSGKLLDPDKIIEIILNDDFKRTETILITAGGTKESIDGIRQITNLSTGKTASTIAQYFIDRAYPVTYLCTEDAKLPSGNFRKENFSNFNSLESQLKSILSSDNYSFVIHNAAVSDYSLAELNSGSESFNEFPLNEKLSSSNNEIVIKLKKNKKLINDIKHFSKNKNVKLVGFKFLNGCDQNEKSNAVKKLFEESNADLVISNDYLNRVNSVQTGFEIWQNSEIVETLETSEQLAQNIEKLLIGN